MAVAGEMGALGGRAVFLMNAPKLVTATALHELSSGIASYSLFPGERAGVRAGVLFLLLLSLLGASPVHAQDTITNFMSPVVSYQYLDAIGSGTDTVVMSPVASYQYFDSLGGTGVGSQQSAAVSYFYNVPSGGQSFTLSGRVVDATGTAVSGANVIVSLLETTQVTATTSADGAFQLPALAQGVYVFTAAKTGFTRDRRVVSFGAGTTRQNFRLLPAAAQATVQTVSTPPPFAPPDAADIEGSTLQFFDGTQFIPELSQLNATKMTVVLTHGWNSSPSVWAATIAVALKNKGLLPSVNIVAWDWRTAAAKVLPPEEITPKQGVALGKALYRSALGSGYAKPVHFMGHSLGAVVNAAAANYLHGDGEGRQERAAPKWSARARISRCSMRRNWRGSSARRLFSTR